MAGTIQDILQIIKNGIYGRDIRQAIYDGIELCYNDVIDTASKQELVNRIDNLSRETSDIRSLSDFDIVDSATWESGSINISTGANTSDPRRIRTTGYIDVSSVEVIDMSIDSGYKYYYYFYNENKEKVYNSPAWITADTSVLNYGNYKYLRVVLADTGDGTASLDYATHFHATAKTKLNRTIDNANYLLDSAITDNLVDLFDITLWK